MSKSYKVKTFNWENGTLVTNDYKFETREQAINYAQRSGGHHSKVIDHQEQVIYQQKNYQQDKPAQRIKVRKKNHETYA